jgi:signal peptidase II
LRLIRFRPTRRLALTLCIAAAVVAGDALSKRAVQEALALGERHDIVPGLLVLTHVQNTGAAYGLLTGHRWLLVLTAAVVAAATPLLLRSLPVAGRWAWSGPVLTGLILGGAIGNLAERTRHGYVTDFIQVPPIELFQVFNLSDASISVAITAVLAISFFGGEAPSQPKGSAEPPAVTVPDTADELTR